MLSDAQILVSNNTILSFFAFIIFTHEYNETANKKNAASRQDQTFDFIRTPESFFQRGSNFDNVF